MRLAVHFSVGNTRISIIIGLQEAQLVWMLRPAVVSPMSLYKEEMAI